MREQWLDILTQRQEYLDQQLQKIVSKPGAAARSSDVEAEMIDRSSFSTPQFTCQISVVTCCFLPRTNQCAFLMIKMDFPVFNLKGRGLQ